MAQCLLGGHGKAAILPVAIQLLSSYSCILPEGTSGRRSGRSTISNSNMQGFRLQNLSDAKLLWSGMCNVCALAPELLYIKVILKQLQRRLQSNNRYPQKANMMCQCKPPLRIRTREVKCICSMYSSVSLVGARLCCSILHQFTSTVKLSADGSVWLIDELT